MRTVAFLLVLAAPLAAQPGKRGVVDNSASPHAKVRNFDLDSVQWTDGFWAGRFNTVAAKSVPAMWKVMQDSGNSANLVNLKIAAGLDKGKFHGNDWSDGDVYKVVETMAAVWLRTRDPQLDRQMDEAIAVIAKAQTPEGYIGTQTQLTDKKRWGSLRYHELYNMGHLITAACVHKRITGKDNFLAVARKTGDYLYGLFKPRPADLAHFGFNPSQLMGLVELTRLTGDPKYLDLANIFTSMRGSRPGGTDLNQSRVSLRTETDAVGHSVTGPYLWAGATDVYAETGEQELWTALVRLWEDVSYRKMYVTGGIAAINNGVSFRGDPVHEAFGFRYQLPNAIAYNETCANIAHAMWSWRMLGVSGEARYADVVEQVLYNTFLSGWGLDGTTYCYTNPLRRDAKEDRLLRNDSWERWPATTTPGAPYCYCCPPNVTRTVAELAGWAYGWSQDVLWVNLYGANTLKSKLPSGAVIDLAQQTEYPWQGQVKFTFRQGTGRELSIRLRIPGWAEKASLKVNGAPVTAPALPGSYAEVRRAWKAGDTIELDLPMEVRLLEANPKVEEARNQVAVARGPVVYALESVDLPAGVKPTDVALPLTAKLTARHDKSLLGGVTVIEGDGRLVRQGDWTGQLYRSVRPSRVESVPLKLIPYYAWNNRGVPYMSVWIPATR
jgi:uncharacterized protein